MAGSVLVLKFETGSPEGRLVLMAERIYLERIRQYYADGLHLDGVRKFDLYHDRRNFTQLAGYFRHGLFASQTNFALEKLFPIHDCFHFDL
jgi:hypothetical protein